MKKSIICNIRFHVKPTSHKSEWMGWKWKQKFNFGQHLYTYICCGICYTASITNMMSGHYALSKRQTYNLKQKRNLARQKIIWMIIFLLLHNAHTHTLFLWVNRNRNIKKQTHDAHKHNQVSLPNKWMWLLQNCDKNKQTRKIENVEKLN